MNDYRKVTEDLYWVGVNDRRTTLFENIHPIPEGISYNSYLLLDEKTVLLDTVDWIAGRELLDNLKGILGDRNLDYLILNHVEPDHGNSIGLIMREYPNVKIVGNKKTFTFIEQFGFNPGENKVEVKDGDSINFGKHTYKFILAPMVHWPETMVSYDETDKILFSGDAFGSFGALNGKLFSDEVDFERDFLVPARRYYTNIVGKYGAQVQSLLKKASDLEISYICPLHGPVWRNSLPYIIDKYDRWSRYAPEEDGVLIVYGSMYGNTEAGAELLASKLSKMGINNTVMYDASRTAVSYLIAEAFRYSHIVIASATYNLSIYTPVENFLMDMKALGLKNRKVGIIENGTWAPRAGKLSREILESMTGMEVLDSSFLINSSLKEDTRASLDELAKEIVGSIKRN